MEQDDCYLEPVRISDYIRSCTTVEEALGVTLERMHYLEQVTRGLIAGKTKVAECLHAIASHREFTDYERTYVAFKFTETIAHSLRSTAEDPNGLDEDYMDLLTDGCGDE